MSIRGMASRVAIIAIIAAAIGGASAQETVIKRTPLRTIEFPPGFTTVTALVEIAPNHCAGRHTHPGIESGYVLQGDVTLKVEGMPDRTIKAGDSFDMPPNTPHDPCTTGGFKAVLTYIVEKGKPLASAAP